MTIFPTEYRYGGKAMRRWTVLAICCLSLFVVGLDTTIVNVALPEIGRGLGADIRGLEQCRVA